MERPYNHQPPLNLDSALVPNKPLWVSAVTVITGTIASGKSEVLSMLRERGIFAISADELARELTKPGCEATQEIATQFGSELIGENGELNRKALAHIVFADPVKKEALEDILHPRIQTLAEQRFSEALSRGISPLVYEVPLLFEVGLNGLGFKKIVLITSDMETCERRMIENRHYSQQDARARIANQWSVERKVAQSDVVIDNSQTLAELEQKVDQLIPLL